jgi:hypothetical protein
VAGRERFLKVLEDVQLACLQCIENVILGYEREVQMLEWEVMQSMGVVAWKVCELVVQEQVVWEVVGPTKAVEWVAQV